MSTTRIQDSLAGEDLIGIEPELLQQVDAGWLQRLSLFTGRTLSDTALINEQQYRAGHLALLAQAVTQGTVQGLDLSVDLAASDPVLTLSPGYGISAAGQDVTLLRAMRTTLSGLAVIDGQTGSYIADFKTYNKPAQPWAGILLLQPIVADVAGSVVDTGSGDLIVSGNLGASCDQDPSEYAFGDSQIVDGARLVLATWPSGTGAPALPAATPTATWRNRLAYAIFNSEIALPADNYQPWEFWGTPIALAAFDATSKLIFVDRSAVVRAGGLPRRRYILPGPLTLTAVQPALATARVNQFAEQLGQDASPSNLPGLITNEFASLPPAGILPPWTMDFVKKVASWCPSNWSVTAAPIFTEELEGAIETAMTAAPLDTTANEKIEILVPLPDAVYDPDILVTESPNPAFQEEVDAATLARNIVLQHRHIIQQESNALAPLISRPLLDTSAGLTVDEMQAVTGTSVFAPLSSEAFGTTLSGASYVSTDLQSLQQTAAAAPYTVTAGAAQIPLFSADDWTDLETNGIQHFVNRINAKLNSANDLLDLAFLTSQTDIYRYRQNVLGTTDASRLAVSPILANIASGDTASATAQNIRDYLTSIQPVATQAPTTTTTPAPTTTQPISIRALSLTEFTNASPVAAPVFLNTQRIAVTEKAPVEQVNLTAATTQESVITTFRPSVANTPVNLTRATQATINPIDITQQSPIVGAQLNLRTLTIAERLAPSAAQEAMFYSVGNRVALLQLLSALEITIDDLPILVDNLPAGTVAPVMADLRPTADPTRTALVYQLVNNPQIAIPAQVDTNPDESTLFSTGVHVLEQHTQLLRAVEARIQQYQDFLSLCTNAIGNIQSDMSSAHSLLTQLGNDLTQSRQNLSFVQSLFADELTRVAGVNARRTSVLQTYVQFVGFVRPRTVIIGEAAASRQLVPAVVTSPVPACLKQIVAIPPELSEVVALLREAPVSWLPPILKQLPRLTTPSLLQDLASSTQVRATMQLQQKVKVSSAASETGLFASKIASIYSANQSTIRTVQMQRAAFQPAAIVNQSWSAQLGVLQNVVAVSDLLVSAAVHPEITSAVSRSLQQISSVATCLYTRVGQALPVDRLEWANYLDKGMVSLRNLAVLPGWNTQNYTDRQQMQLLVDWLYQQIDTTNQTMVSLMNDVIATAILLASQAPVGDIIAGAVALRTTPVINNPIRLTLPSARIAQGMSVQLYSGVDLAARAVVSDLDSSGVTATITDIYKTNVAFEANDVAHFTALDQNAVVYKAFSK